MQLYNAIDGEWCFMEKSAPDAIIIPDSLSLAREYSPINGLQDCFI